MMLILVRAEWLSLRKASEDLQIDTGLERQTGPGPGHGCWHRAASAVYQAALLQHTCASSLTHALRARPQEELQVDHVCRRSEAMPWPNECSALIKWVSTFSAQKRGPRRGAGSDKPLPPPREAVAVMLHVSGHGPGEWGSERDGARVSERAREPATLSRGRHRRM